jgi:hypothetical protein
MMHLYGWQKNEIVDKDATSCLWHCILGELEACPSPGVRLVTPAEMAWRTNSEKIVLSKCMGQASQCYRMITAAPGQGVGDMVNTLWHELLHILFQSSPHWWIECSAAVLSGVDRNRPGKWSIRYGYDVSNVPTRNELIKMCKIKIWRRQLGI